MRRKKSPILDAALSTTKGLHEAGAFDQVTMREFDALACPFRRCAQRRFAVSANPGA